MALSLMSSASYFAAADELHAREHARREAAVLVVEQAARVDGAGVRVELVVEEHHVAFVRMACFVGEADPHRVGVALRALAATAAPGRRSLRYTCSSPSNDT